MKAIAAHFLATYAQLVADKVTENLEAVLGSGGEAPAAIIHIGHAPGLSILELSVALGLSHPGTVRLVDKLVDTGMAERTNGRDGRTRLLALTPKGKAMRDKLLAARLAAAESVMVGLSDTEWETIRDQLARIIKTVPESAAARPRICRLCDRGMCRFYFNLKSTTGQEAALQAEGGCDLYRLA